MPVGKDLYTMARPLNYEECKFRKAYPCVFISSDIKLDVKDGSAKVTKWISDYINERPKGITTSFTPPVRSDKPWHPLFIHRYVHIDRLMEDILDNKITFVSPTMWDDPFEGMFYNKELKIDKKLLDIRCICTTYDCVYNEEAAWNRANNKENTVRVSYKFKEFCEMLSEIGQQNVCRFFLSVADYSQSKDNMLVSNIKDEYSAIGKYIKLMSLKRKAFAYENELRIFAVFEKAERPLNDIESFKLCSKNYSEVINHITLPPLKPNKSINKFFDYDKLQEAKNAPIKKKLKDYLPTVKIQESRLYSKN